MSWQFIAHWLAPTLTLPRRAGEGNGKILSRKAGQGNGKILPRERGRAGRGHLRFNMHQQFSSALVGFRWMLLASLLLLNACTTQPQRIAGTSSARDATELRDWTASGRIGISGIEQSGSGGFTWTQQAELAQVQVRGPVGVGALQISMNGAHLRMQASDGTQYDADQVLAELESRLGASVPVAQLRYWLLGLPAPGEHRWSDNTHAVLEQAGWRVVYSDWLQRDSLRLPAKLTLTRDQLRILMVVQSWRVDA